MSKRTFQEQADNVKNAKIKNMELVRARRNSEKIPDNDGILKQKLEFICAITTIMHNNTDNNNQGSEPLDNQMVYIESASDIVYIRGETIPIID